MPKGTIRFLLRSMVVLSVALAAMFLYAGGSSAQGAPKIPPMAGANAVPATPDLDQLAQSVAQTLGFDPQYAYEVWAIPGATWDSAFKYYSTRLPRSAGKTLGRRATFRRASRWGIS